MSHGGVEMAGHRLEVNCPHVENGTCAECLWPQVMPYVAARHALDTILPKLTLFAEMLREQAKDAERSAKAAEALRDWAQKMADAKWVLGPETKP